MSELEKYGRVMKAFIKWMHYRDNDDMEEDFIKYENEWSWEKDHWCDGYNWGVKESQKQIQRLETKLQKAIEGLERIAHEPDNEFLCGHNKKG